MSVLEAIVLGIIQGLTEFLPISSTAHLTLAGKFMDLVDPNNPEHWTAFIATIQLGTLLAVFVYFAQDIKNIPIAFFKENFGKEKKKYNQQSTNSRMGWLIILGSIPIATIGLALKKVIEGEFTKDPYVIASSLIGLAIILWIAEKRAKFNKQLDNISIKDSVLVGLAQCVALIPGSSRSGTTITAGLFLGMNRETAARFSFLLSIPAIFGSGLLQFYKSLEYINSDGMISLIIATVVSALSGYVAIAGLIKFLKSKSTLIFIVYRIIIGLAVFYFAYNGLI